jgi:hypothetical protein
VDVEQHLKWDALHTRHELRRAPHPDGALKNAARPKILHYMSLRLCADRPDPIVCMPLDFLYRTRRTLAFWHFAGRSKHIDLMFISECLRDGILKLHQLPTTTTQQIVADIGTEALPCLAVTQQKLNRILSYHLANICQLTLLFGAWGGVWFCLRPSVTDGCQPLMCEHYYY